MTAFYLTRKFDPKKGFRLLKNFWKQIYEISSLRNTIRGFNTASDIHKLMENAVYLHLKQSGYTVFVGKMGDKEIDFMAEREGSRIYVQVTLSAMEEKTREREFGNLMEIGDNYPKYVVALNDMIVGNDYKGIHYINLADFLAMGI